jgi:hypothetical protein
MCVIAVINESDKRPSAVEVEAMWNGNQDGAGVAWFEGDVLRWEKGLTLDELKEHVETLPVPFTMHCRIASVGPITPRLTHPFPVTPAVELHLEGSSKTFPILFHNGTWTDWMSKTFNLAGSMGYKLPSGKWSDTRAMALMAAHYGLGALEMINEKIIIMDPTEKGANRVRSLGYGWELYGERFIVSNTGWVKNINYYEGPSRWIRTTGGSNVVGTIVPQSLPVIPPVHQPGQQKMLPAPQGGGSTATGPFEQPLRFYEERHQKGLIPAKGINKIRKYFKRIAMYPAGKSEKPKVMLEIEAQMTQH